MELAKMKKIVFNQLEGMTIETLSVRGNGTILEQ